MGKVRISLLAGSILLALPITGAFAEEGEVAGSGEIIVTARKRAETLQDVPMAVTAITNEELEVRDTRDVNGLFAEVPGLFSAPGSVNNSADFAYLTMRGVGFNAGLEPAVGVFLDGMYMPQLAFDASFLDVERAEVLRGPQGTLFGRNTQGGALNLVTRKPGDDFRGKLLFGVSGDGGMRAQGLVSGPISNAFYASVGVEHARSDGFIRNSVLGGRQDWWRQTSLRGVLRWAPTASLDISLISDWTNRDYNEAIRGVRRDTSVRGCH